MLTPTAAFSSPNSTGAAAAAGQSQELQLQAGRAARVLGFLLHQNPAGQHRLLALQVSEDPGDTLLGRCVRLLSECCRRSDAAARQVCCSVLRMLLEWCGGCEAAVAALLAAPSHLPLLVDMVGGRVAGGDANTAGKIGHCLEGFVVWGEKFRRMCCSVLRLLVEWCGGCEARPQRCWQLPATCRCWWMWFGVT
jgi:hypothetical protein